MGQQRCSTPAPPTVILAQADALTDHFEGVDAALAARGLACTRILPDQAPVRFGDEVRVVVVKDTHTFTASYALDEARRVGAVTVLLMDGIVEWRNTFLNPRSGPAFLRPAPVDVVACAGEMDRRTLAALGNDAVATGLPRLRRVGRAPRPRRGPVLVATANQPAFSEVERERLIASLAALLDAAAELGVELLWRLTGGLDAELGVASDRRPLAESLAEAAAVVTTPSTLMVEAMLADRPTALLHPHPTPLWQPCAWLWRGVGAADTPDRTMPSLEFAGLHRDLARLTRRATDAAALLRGLLADDLDRAERQERILAAMHRPGDGAERLAELCAELAAHPRRAAHGRRMPTLVRTPARAPASPERPRVVSLVHCDGSPVGGVTTWSFRLADEFARRGLGYDVRTLLITSEPHALPERLRDRDDALTSVCVYDPFADHTEILRTVRGAVEALGPSVVLPNYTDLAYMVAAQLRPRGVRTVAIAHTDDASVRELLSFYDRWDGAVGVSAACARWLAPLCGDRPFDTIVYGVPIADEPRAGGFPHDPARPLRLAYIGRMVQEQKRVFDLLGVIDGLEARGVAYEFHAVGDGFEFDAWKRALAERRLASGRVVCHGRRDPGWVERFLPTIDVSVLVSDYEGTSISMLEAMGAGVVPAVTRVESGVEEWVRDGENGVVVPRRSPDAMAARLAELARDRAMLARLGRAAWETARRGVGLPRMAEAYRRVFDRVLAREVDRRPTDLGLRPLDLWRWRKDWSADPARSEAYVRSVMAEAGYARIALDAPRPGCDAVLVRAGRAAPSPEQVRAWREQGLGVAFAPHLETLTERVRPLVAAAARAGRRRIAVFGIGKHTRKIASLFGSGLPFVGFIDDAPPPWGTMLGMPVVPLERAMSELRPDAVLLSSDAYEATMWERCAPLRRAGVRIIPIYGVYDDGAAPAVEPSPAVLAA